MIKHKNEEYYTNQHSKFLLQYHLIFITKYRHPVIIKKRWNKQGKNIYS